jgi:hypothetical protein
MNILDVQTSAMKRDDMAAEYATMSTEFGELTGKLDLLWLEKRAMHPDATDKFIDKLIGASEEGQRFNVLKFKMKGYEKRISSLNSIITVANNEARNNY